MWWLTVPLAAGLGKWMYDRVNRTAPESSYSPSETILVRNLRALRDATIEPDPRRVAFLGQPGAGKSTLIKKLSKGRARPVPIVGTETDATNWAEQLNVDLLCRWGKRSASDVPGYDTVNHPSSTYLAHFPFDQFARICLVLNGKVRAADQEVYQAIRDSGTPVIVVRSYAESLNEHQRDAVSQDLHLHLFEPDPSNIVFVSSRTGEGIERLRLMM